MAGVSPSPATFSLGRFADLAERVLATPPRPGPVRLVAIDGPGGSGKTTFAGRLAAALGDAQVVHTDDFVDSWGDPMGFWPRLREQVLDPLLAGRAGRYQRYDWLAGELAGWHDVPLAPAVVIEGVSSARRDVAGALTLAVWVETPPSLRLRRALARDGAGMLEQWRLWMSLESAHFATDATRERADVFVDGDPVVPHDAEQEYVVPLESDEGLD